MRVEVFNGHINLRDPELVPERYRRPVFEMSAKGAELTADAEIITAETIAFFSNFNDVVAIAMIESWSFGDTVTLDALIDLPARTYDDIRNAVAPYLTKLMPDFGVNPDPKAITEQ